VFGRKIEIDNWIGNKVGGRRVEPVVSGMLVDGELLYPGGDVTTETFLGTLEVKRFEGQAASNVLALNRMSVAPEPPLQRSSTDRSRSIDERLRRLGIGVANR
jgi:hypothetical protein